MTQAAGLSPQEGERMSWGFGGSGAYFAALEVWVGARVGRSIALSSSQTQDHNITQGLLKQGVVASWEASRRPASNRSARSAF